MKVTLLTLLGIALFVGATFGIKEASLWWKERYSVKEQNIDRKVFKETRAFNEGKVQELSKLRLEYLKARANGDTVSTSAIRSTIQHTFADYDRTKLNPELSNFLATEIFNY